MVFFVASLVACGLVFLVYLYAARPMADDFGRASCATLVEAIRRTGANYTDWSGRWASIGIQHIGWSLIPQRSPNISLYYSGFLGAILLVCFGGLFGIMKCLLRGSIKHLLLQTVAVALFLFSFYHDPAQTVFWIPGATEGGLAVVLMSLAIWMVLNALASDRAPGAVRHVWIGLCLLVGSGCHELAGMTASAFFVLLLLWSIPGHDRRGLPLLAFAIFISLIAASISVFAPGNAVRAALEYGDHLSAADALNSLSQLLLRTTRVVLSPQLLLGIPVALIFLRRSDSIRAGLLAHTRLIQAAGGAMFLALIVVASVYSIKTGAIPAARTVNFFCSSFILVVVPAVMVVLINRLKSDLAVPNGKLQPCLLGLLGIVIFAGPTLDRGIFSYKKNLIPWIRYQEEKHRSLLLHAESPQPEVIIRPGPPPPPLLFTESELVPDPNAWSNTVQAHYYGIKRLTVRQDQ